MLHTKADLHKILLRLNKDWSDRMMKANLGSNKALR